MTNPVQIPDAAVQAALEAWPRSGVPYDFPIVMLAALTAALPHLPLGFDVKKLEWVDAKGVSEATEFGRLMRYFAVHVTNGKGEYSWTLEFNGKFFRQSKTLDEAKSIAQADFERRVRECIIAKPVDVAAIRRQAFEDACDVIDGNGEYDQQLCCNGHMCGCKGATVHQQMKHYIRALSAEPAQGEQWQPIETAPKDGTKIDVWMMPQGYRLTDVFWSDIQDAWCRESEYPNEPTPLSVVPYPAFWIPLPAAPTSESEA